jgi:aromatic ring-opening dioxygenase LigB subunit
MPHPPIIIPEVGKGEENKAKGTVNGCKRAAEEIKGSKPGVIVIITPHGPLFRDSIAISHVDVLRGDLGKFGVPKVDLR